MRKKTSQFGQNRNRGQVRDGSSRPPRSGKLSPRPESRRRVDFENPLQRRSALAAQGISLCAYLVTLAAYQRGLEVVFHYDLAAKSDYFGHRRHKGWRGELFSVSDGRKTHYFRRSMGDLTTNELSNLIEDKHQTKRVLEKAGVVTPRGVVIMRTQMVLAEKFVRRGDIRRFVVKPFQGSRGIGVHADLAADEALAVVAASKEPRLVIEEYIPGEECRFYVVADRCVAVTGKMAANVVGNGRDSIEQLVAAKNRQRENNPRLATNPIKITDEVQHYMVRQGLSLASVPAAGERIILSALGSISQGGDTTDLTDTVDRQAKEAAIAACRAIGVANAGVDVILSSDPEDGRPYVLELNQCAHIGSHSFPGEGPGQGNAVAEAIIDYYFPDSVNQRSRSELAYDFAIVRQAMQSRQVSELALPVVTEQWLAKRFRLSGQRWDPQSLKVIDQAMQAAGCHGCTLVHADGTLQIDLVCHSDNYPVFLDFLPVQLKAGFIPQNRRTA